MVRVIEKLRRCPCPDMLYTYQAVISNKVDTSRHILMTINKRETQSMKLMVAKGDCTRMEEAEHSGPITQLSQIRNLDGAEMTTKERNKEQTHGLVQQARWIRKEIHE